ncbi:histidinol-phosphatase (PHP family) [Salirhabdus euzebyi]|uniref:Histidinol-phosphatase n=1 Tax=Salirhabdus euzebyi TaxID=394506 RepID=A0A841Q6V6_9BACI|nr:histidinol-phosphatase HisJ family protein [Salirhabdus euzebyi]MBB6454141.1 histidinol-phosphatase (PHP family) [Salirhabdus euzebyi]
MYDYHMHSNFSADCKVSMEEMVKAAITKGLKEICFTEHIDYDYPDQSITFDLDTEAYTKKVEAMRQKYGTSISIKKGVELGVQPHVIQHYEKLLEKEHFDFIICSMHATSRLDLHSGTFFENKTLHMAYEEYYTELLACIKSFNMYNILGHLDLVKRYKYENGVHHFLDVIEEIFKVIIPEGKGIEINTSGYKYGMNRALPSKDILQLYKDMNGEIITLGSDSHSPVTLGAYFDESIALLKELGFSYIATFDNHKPVFHKI